MSTKLPTPVRPSVRVRSADPSCQGWIEAAWGSPWDCRELSWMWGLLGLGPPLSDLLQTLLPMTGFIPQTGTQISVQSFVQLP